MFGIIHRICHYYYYYYINKLKQAYNSTWLATITLEHFNSIYENFKISYLLFTWVQLEQKVRSEAYSAN